MLADGDMKGYPSGKPELVSASWLYITSDHTILNGNKAVLEITEYRNFYETTGAD